MTFSAGIGASLELSRPSLSSVQLAVGSNGPVSPLVRSPKIREYCGSTPEQSSTWSTYRLAAVPVAQSVGSTWTSGEPSGLSLPCGPEEAWMSQNADGSCQLGESWVAATAPAHNAQSRGRTSVAGSRQSSWNSWFSGIEPVTL